MTRRFLRRRGAAPGVGPRTSVTWAPRRVASKARAVPISPEEAFDKKRTGSQCSRVGPAVITTFFPLRLLKYLLTRTDLQNLMDNLRRLGHPAFAVVPDPPQSSFFRADEAIAVSLERFNVGAGRRVAPHRGMHG